MITFFGGAFNPPHMGHYLTAAYFLAVDTKSKLLLMPSARHPYGKIMAPFKTRLKWCAMMAKQLGPRVSVTDVEDEIEGEGRTYLVVQLLKKKYPKQKLQMLVGADAYADRHKWYEAEKLLKEISFFSVGRAAQRTEQGHLAMPELSSTEIRERLIAGLPCEGLLPAEVLNDAVKRRVYAKLASVQSAPRRTG